MVSMGHFATPQQAALAAWHDVANANARVVDTTIRGDRAEVVLEVEPNYRYWTYCVHEGQGWREAASGNGPTVGWDDPNVIHWSTT